MLKVASGLCAASQASLRAASREELYRQVCAVALDETLIAAAVFTADKQLGLQYEAGAGAGAERLRHRAARAAADGAPDLIGIALRDGRPCAANNCLNDERVRAWKPAGAASAAALPIIRDGHPAGILLLCAAPADYFGGQALGLAQQLAANIAFALDRFDREAESDRFNTMLSALSAANEAILRAETRDKLFQIVCDTAILGGKFTIVTIILADKDTENVRLVALSGSGAAAMEAAVGTVMPVSAMLSDESTGFTGRAFRTRTPCICNDCVAEPSLSRVQGDISAKAGVNAIATLPLISRDHAVGVMLFGSAERNTFTPQFVELLERLTANVSFALENFDRAQEKEQVEQQIRYLATHDSLTGLPNRAQFDQLLEFSIRTATRFQRQCAVLFIDLDRFKIINDSLGHAAGDALLVEIARRLRNSVRANDVVARLGGDEFMLLLNDVAELHQIEAVARDLVKIVSEPLTLCGHDCHVTASIGIALYPSDGTDKQSLTKNADTAMYLAKAEGRNAVRFFSSEIAAQSVDNLTMEAGLRQALEGGEFVLHYQPQLNVLTRQITGVEALVRWRHPEKGLLSPDQFIPVAEETGLIVPLGGWVLKTACLQNMAWKAGGGRALVMAVNVSPRQFADDSLLRYIDEALAASGMAPRRLQIEITESMVMLNLDRALKILDAVQKRGVRIAIDDFGTGYSSMSMLKQFPIDTIKIDRSFVRGLPRNRQDNGIAQAIISMSKVLGLTVVAEGVESAEQEAFLRGQACDELQGYLFSEPVTPEQIAALLASPSAYDFRGRPGPEALAAL